MQQADSKMLFQLRNGLTGRLGRDTLGQRGLPDATEFDGSSERRDGLEIIRGHDRFFC
jgi:hypothetical protein